MKGVWFAEIEMLTLYRLKICPNCNQIEDRLKDLVLAHRIVEVRDTHELFGFLHQETSLPVMVDEEEVIQGHDAILKHLEELETYKKVWDKYQSDACYCNEDADETADL